MNWVQGIQRAIDYVEANITEEIGFEKAAKQAYASSFHFQRVFGILCGFSLGDYIRMRRLSLAGEELSKGNAKIIDIALKYGYDTPESFSRAFTRFHGIAPSEAKHGGNVRIFTPLSVKLTLTGGSKMDYRIERRAAFQVVCKRKKVGKPQSANATQDITAMWQEYGADDDDHLCRFPDGACRPGGEGRTRSTDDTYSVKHAGCAGKSLRISVCGRRLPFGR